MFSEIHVISEPLPLISDFLVFIMEIGPPYILECFSWHLYHKIAKKYENNLRID